MPVRVTTSDQASSYHGVKFCIFGPSKYGKTRLCATAPAPLVISAEKGLLSLRGYNIPAIEINNPQELTEAFTFVTQSYEARQYWTICLDSLSEIAEQILANAMKLVGKDPRQAYNIMAQQLEAVIKMFRDISGKHVYFICKTEPIKDEMTGSVKWGPMVPGRKMGPQIPYYFDEFFCLRLHPNKDENGQHYRYIQTSPDLQFDAGDRSGALAPIEPPDLNYIINKILGSQT